MKRQRENISSLTQTSSKRPALDEKLPSLSSPYQVELLVRKNEKEEWRSLSTITHAIQKIDENNVHQMLIHSVPDQLFAIRLVNMDESYAAFYITVDGKPTRAKRNQISGHIVHPNSATIISGFYSNGMLAKFMFCKSRIAQDIDDLDASLDTSKFGIISVRVHKAGNRRVDPSTEYDFTNDAIIGNVTLKERDSKKYGLLATSGPVIPMVHTGTNVTFAVNKGKIEREFSIRYCDATGMIGMTKFLRLTL